MNSNRIIKTIPWHQRYDWSVLAISVILVIVAIVLFNHLNYPYPHPADTGRDYLVGRHIALYQERPLVGPWNSAYGLLNSPLYYYVLSLLISVKDDVMFLSIVNISLQIVTVFLVYALAKRLFGIFPAITAAVLFGLSAQLADQTTGMWQPYTTPPFVMTSCLFALSAYRRHSHASLFAGSAVLIFAGALHNAALALLPLYLVVSFLIFKRDKCSWQHYAGIFIVLTGLLSVLYLPVFIFFHRQETSFFELVAKGKISSLNITSSYIDSVPKFIVKLKATAFLFADMTFHTKDPFSIHAFLLGGTLTSIAWYFFKSPRIWREREVFMIVLISSVISFLMFFSIFQLRPSHYYFAPIFGLFVIVIAEAMHGLFRRPGFWRHAVIVPVFLLLYVFSGDFQFFQTNRGLERGIFIPAAVYAMKREILDIQRAEGYPDAYFFRTFNHEYYGDDEDALIMSYLEKTMEQRFVALTDTAPGFSPINDDSYMFLSCYPYGTEKEARASCRNDFLNTKKDYRFLKTVFSEPDLEIHLFQKIK